MFDIPYMWYLKKMTQMNLFTKQKKTHRLREQTYGHRGGRLGEGIAREFGMHMHTQQYLKWIANKDLLHSTWTCVQCNVAAWKRVEPGGELDTFVCMAESLHCSLESQHC